MGKYSVFSLAYMPLIIRLKCCEPVSLPEYLGSTLRGAIGWALSSNREVYTYIYENGKSGKGGLDIVNPYVIDLPRYHSVYSRGDELRFQFILFGEATHYTSDFIRELVKTEFLTLGAERKRFELMEIMQGERLQTIWKKGDDNIVKIQNEILLDDIHKNVTHCAVTLMTPLRIRRKGCLLSQIDFSVIIRNIAKRISQLTERYGGYIDEQEAARICGYANQIQEIACELSLKEIERYSSRRDSIMDVSGMMGTMLYKGELDDFTPWINAARILHIGRNVTFGYGKIEAVCW